MQRKEALSSEEPEGISVQFLLNPSICSDLECSHVFPQLVFGNDATAFKKLGEVGTTKRGAQIAFEVIRLSIFFVLLCSFVSHGI